MAYNGKKCNILVVKDKITNELHFFETDIELLRKNKMSNKLKEAPRRYISHNIEKNRMDSFANNVMITKKDHFFLDPFYLYYTPDTDDILMRDYIFSQEEGPEQVLQKPFKFIPDNMVDVFLLGTYIVDTVSSIREYLKKEKSEISNFSFNSSKFQKILILSLIDYHDSFEQNDCFRLVDYDKNDVQILNASCGLLLDYNCLIFGLSIQSGFNSHDINESLFYYIDQKDIVLFIRRCEAKNTGVSDLACTVLDENLKEQVLNVLFEYILYDPKELGKKLDVYKFEGMPKKITIKELLCKGKE